VSLPTTFDLSPPTGAGLSQTRSSVGLTVATALTFFACIYLQRLGYVTQGGGAGDNFQEIPLATVFAFISIFIFWWEGRLWGSYLRLAAFCVAFAAMMATLLFAPKFFSPFALIYALTIYAPFVLVVPVDDDTYKRLLNIFQRMMVPIAIIAIWQSCATNLLHQRFPDYLAQVVPANFLQLGFNTYAGFGEDFIRPNAIFFLEPSFVSQYAATALIVEWLWFRRPYLLALFGAAVIAALSGTGMLLLIFFAVVLMIKERKFMGIIAGVIVLVVVQFLDPDSIFGQAASRVSEIGDPNASGYQRFVGPIQDIPYALGNDFSKWMFGLGAGQSRDLGTVEVPFAPFPLAKVMAEYGLLGALGFLPFLCVVFFSAPMNGILAASVFFSYNLLSGNFTQSHTDYLYWLLACLFIREKVRN
jgi:hypothetical protein